MPAWNFHARFVDLVASGEKPHTEIEQPTSFIYPDCRGIGYVYSISGVTRDCDCVRNAVRAAKPEAVRVQACRGCEHA